MKFKKDIPCKLVMLGAGGTGGYIAPHLYRLLHVLPRETRFIIADGDLVEEKNLIRQNFIRPDIGQNKAKVLAERYADTFGLAAQYIPEYIEGEERLYSLLHNYDYDEELVILIGAVDNNKSRALCHWVFSRLKNIIYIDAGNGEDSGQVVCGIRRGGRNFFAPVASLYPEVLEPTDRFPSELSCAQAAQAAPQSVIANLMAATTVVAFVYNILAAGNLNVHAATFSTNSIHMRPVKKQQKKKAG